MHVQLCGITECSVSHGFDVHVPCQLCSQEDDGSASVFSRAEALRSALSLTPTQTTQLLLLARSLSHTTPSDLTLAAATSPQVMKCTDYIIWLNSVNCYLAAWHRCTWQETVEKSAK